MPNRDKSIKSKKIVIGFLNTIIFAKEITFSILLFQSNPILTIIEKFVGYKILTNIIVNTAQIDTITVTGTQIIS